MKNYFSKQPIGSEMNVFRPKSIIISIYLFIFFPIFLSNSSISFISLNFEEVYSHYGHIKLIASSETNASSTDFYFNSNATAGLDPGYDATLIGGIIPQFSLYSHLVENNTGSPFAIQSLSDGDMNNVTIPLGLHATQGQQITLRIFETDLPSSVDIFLEDTFNNTSTLLNTDHYTFNTDSDISGTGRFFLRLVGDALNVIELSLEDINIYSDKTNKRIVVDGQFLSKATLKLYDISGKLITIQSLDGTYNQQIINSDNLQAGVFIVEITNDLNERKVQKLVVN